jgi:hypothetical protein
MLGHIHGDPAWARTQPPLTPMPSTEAAAVVAGYEAIRGKRAA